MGHGLGVVDDQAIAIGRGFTKRIANELVNLAPTTGPVPIMVPHQRQPEPEPEPEAAVDIDSTDAIDVPDLTDTIDDDT
ncbi:MAG: hypothetical protein ACPGUF_03920, partial [Litorivicinus sp.]